MRRVAALGSVLLLAAGCGAAGMTAPTASVAESAPSAVGSAVAPVSVAAPVPSGAPITVLPPEPASDDSPTPTSSVASAGAASAAAGSSSVRVASTTDATPATTAPTATAASLEPTIVRTTVGAPAVRGTVVVLDPGHNGGNAAHPKIINKLVPAGFGLKKACNTTGTATNAGYSEHAFNWSVALAVRGLLQARGVTVVMTRDSDTGVGPCVDRRAAIGNDAHAAAVVSIHGDGEAANVAGFFVMTSSHDPGGAQVAAQTARLAGALRSGMTAGGFRVSNTIGTNGLWARSDLGGLNLSTVPTVMIECGNMRNAAEAAAMSSAAGRQKYAAAIAAGILGYLAG